MKLSDKFQPAQLTATPWSVYEECADAIGVILDNRFKDPHRTVYEHQRHTAADMPRHKPLAAAPTIEPDSPPELALEERELLGVLNAPERGRRLNIVGDVGVGKTTFIKHMMSEHFGRADFVEATPIYIDFADFTALAGDPLPEVRKKFVQTVWAALEALVGPDKLVELDQEIFRKSALFSVDRQLAFKLAEPERTARMNAAFERLAAEDAVKFTFERLNYVCGDNQNRLILVVDNIDHLPDLVLKVLGAFFIEVQLDVLPLLVVAMRDHTYQSPHSGYREDGTVLAWNQRLYPPNLKLVIERRVATFFPPEGMDTAEPAVSIGRSLKVERNKADVIRALLKSPFEDEDTYNFIRAYTNYNLRDLFRNLQRIVGFPGYRGFGSDFFKEDQPKISVGIDECLIALALQRQLMFFPAPSPIFNAYSAGDDSGSMDKIVAARVLQLLDRRTEWTRFSDLVKTLVGWGYGERAIKAQVLAMVSKDLVWTSTGSPNNFSDSSGLFLSYRGQLYSQRILRRTVYNYLMSFDVDAPDRNHPIYRDHKSELRAELEGFADLKTNFETDTIAFRVLGLAEIIFEVEKAEVKSHKKRSSFDNFSSEVRPSSVSIGVLNGLIRFLERTHQRNGHLSRYIPPTTSTLKAVGDTLQEYRAALGNVFVEQ